jgi:exonuclease VII large subunit
MKMISRILLLSTFPFALATINAQSISPAEAKNHIRETVKVCGKVAGERTATNSKGSPTFINLDAPFPNQVFTIVIWEEDRQEVGTLPREGSRVCVTGKIQTYKGVPEIVARGSTQLSR